jgi:predicted nucleic acid-binding protein
LDASVAVSWCFPGDLIEDTAYSRGVLRELIASDAVVPEIWAFEIANFIFVSCNRRRRIDQQQAQEYWERLRALPIRVETQDIWANVGLQVLARRRDLAAYDAAYLDLALRTGFPLATSDLALSQAALAEGIKVLDVPLI